MTLKITKEYRLQGERNNRPRQPIIFEDKIYLIFVYDKKGFVESRIQCLQLSSFELIWEYTHNHVINNIFVSSEKTLIASCMNGFIINFDLANGKQIWQFKASSNIGFVSNESDQKIVFSSIQSREPFTWCLDIHGTVIWQQSNSGHSYIPKIENDLIYNCIENDIFCLNLSDGKQVWKAHESETYLFNPKVVSDFTIASGHGLVNFYDRKLGELKMQLYTGVRSGIREIIHDENNLYFGDEDGFFYSYSIISGNLNWKIDTGGGIETAPAIIAEQLFVTNSAPKMLLIDKKSGEVSFEKKAKGTGSNITLHNNKIYFSCYGGYLFEGEIQ